MSFFKPEDEKYVVIAAGQWGRGTTLLEAAKNAGIGAKKQRAIVVRATFPITDVWVDDNGWICTVYDENVPPEYRPNYMAESCRLSIRKGEVNAVIF